MTETNKKKVKQVAGTVGKIGVGIAFFGVMFVQKIVKVPSSPALSVANNTFKAIDEWIEK